MAYNKKFFILLLIGFVVLLAGGIGAYSYAARFHPTEEVERAAEE